MTLQSDPYLPHTPPVLPLSKFTNALMSPLLRWPLTLLLLAAGCAVVPLVVPLPETWLQCIALGARCLVIVAIALLLQKLLLRFYRRFLMTRPTLRTYAGLTRLAISGAVYTLALLLFLDTAGISITPLLASLGIGGVAVALAAQESLTNFFAGVYLVADRPLRVGDYIQLDATVEGFVESIGWRSVWIRTLSNNTVIVPNAKLAGSTITNYDMPDAQLAVLMDLGVAYGSNLDDVERVTIAVAKEVMQTVLGGITDFEPFIRVHTFAETSINFTVIMRGKAFVDQYLIKHEFAKRIHRRYREEGISFPVMVRTVRIQPTAGMSKKV